MAEKVAKVLGMLRDFAPEQHCYKQEYDNIGLILGNEQAEITKVLCCLDVTEKVIDEAISLGCELIISHHPFIYSPVKSITADTVQGRKILKAAQNKINIYSAHTNLDFVTDGINDYLADKLGLRNIKPLDPYIDAKQGFGRVGDLANKIYCSALMGEVENLLKDNHVRVIGEPYSQVKRVAVINGGGGGDTKYIDMAIAEKADCLITADVKHHVAVYAAECGLTLIEPQHYTMEHCYIARLIQILKIEAKSRKIDLEIFQSQRDISPRF